MIFLLEVDYYDRNNGVAGTLFLTTANNYSREGKVYVPALSTGLSYEEFLFGRGSVGGISASAVGEIVIPNADGEFDYLENASFSGRTYRSYYVDDSREPQLYVTGVITSSEFSIDEVTFTVSDRFASLDTPLITNKFAGTNLGMGAAGGLEGGVEIKGQNKPRLYGRCRNIQPYVINVFQLIYACNYDKDGNRAPVHSFWNVFGKGAEYLFQEDVADMDALIALDVDESYYATCIAEGAFKLGTVPNGEVTCDVMESFGEESSVARCVEKILLDFPEVEVDLTSLESVHSLSKCPAGLYVTGEETTLECINLLLNSLEAWMVPDVSGKAFFGATPQLLKFPKHVIDGRKIAAGTLERLPSTRNKNNVPNHSVTILHTKNWKVLEQGSLIDSIPEDLLGFLSLLEFFSTQYRKAVVSSPSVLVQEPTSEAVEYETLLQEPVVAKLRNGNFFATFANETPLDWLVGIDDGASVNQIEDGICTLTIGGAGTYIYLQQILDGDEIYSGEYTLSFELHSGTADVYIEDGASLIHDFHYSDAGLVEITFTLSQKPLEIRIGTSGAPVAVSSVKLQESTKWGTPDTEAQRRFNTKSVPEDRYKFDYPYELAKDFRLGDQVLFKLDRFGLEEGEVFLVIGRELNFPSIDIGLDLWRFRDGN